MMPTREQIADIAAEASVRAIAKMADRAEGQSYFATLLRDRGWMVIPPPASLSAAGGTKRKRRKRKEG